MKDLSRIIEAMSEEEAIGGPVATKYVKDVLLMNLWPAVIRIFYPMVVVDGVSYDTYHLGDALREMHLKEFFDATWVEVSIQWIDILMERAGIPQEWREALLRLFTELIELILARLMEQGGKNG